MGGLVGYWVGLVWLVGWKIERKENKKAQVQKELRLKVSETGISHARVLKHKIPVLRKNIFHSEMNN